MNDLTDEELRDDIFQYGEDALEILGDATYADFLNDRNLRFAVFYLVAVVGEAAAKTSDDGRRRYPAPGWRQFRNLRNMLIHRYHSVNPRRVYKEVTVDLPAFLAALQTPAR